MEHLFRALPTLLNEFDDNESVREAVVFAAWKRTAGDLLCEHSAPVKLEEKHLSIAVPNVMWQRHLQDLAGQMLFQLNSALGSAAVTFIDFVVDEDFVIEHCRSIRKIPMANVDSPESDSRITVDLLLRSEAIEDNDLRRSFLQAAASCIERNERMLHRERKH